MNNAVVNNKRIVKNTFLLYIRMLLTMVVTLYTSRVVLNALGIEDFGIYNVVGGIVAMLNFLNSSMSMATQRFLNYEMGQGHRENLKKVFSTSFISYCIIAVVVIIIAETVGIWFLLNKLVIPAERMSAAIWIYHFSIITFVINLLSVPYNAAIIAYEKMSAFAYISILEVMGKLLIAFLITISPMDQLIFYGLLTCIFSLVVRTVYSAYCRRYFEECKIGWFWDKSLLKRLFGFSGWMLAGTTSQLFNTQGVNILVNMFFGPSLNATRAISVQVHNAVNAFAVNFMMATRPQIVKSYAQEDYVYMYKLVFSSSKLSFILLSLLSLPILMDTEYILVLWLKQIPEYTSLFVQLTLIDLLITSAFSPIASLSQASGKIKNYQLIISVGFILIFVITWVLYSNAYPAYYTFLVSIIINLIGLFTRIYELKFSQKFPVRPYIRQVFLPVSVAFIFMLISSWSMRLFFAPVSSVISLLWHVVIYWVMGVVIVWSIILNRNEQDMVKNILCKIIRK